MKPTKFRAAKVRANSFDESSNTVDIIWTTGASVRRTDWDGEYDEVLSLEPDAVDLSRLNAGAPLLDTHQDGAAANIVGVIVEGSAKIEGGRGTATVLLSKAPGVSDTVQKIREGTARNVSVGYWIEHSVRTDGDPAQVLVDKWTPLEISVVPIPADPGSQVRSVSGRRVKPRLSKTERDYAKGAAMATRLTTQSTQPHDAARGAEWARKLLARAGRFRTEPVKPALNKDEVARGARMARKLLRKS